MATPGFVYLIGPLGGCHKIGMSVDPESRARALSRPGSFLGVAHTIATDDMRWLERVLHAAFDGARVGGEWFQLTAGDVVGIKQLATIHVATDLPEWLMPHTNARYRPMSRIESAGAWGLLPPTFRLRIDAYQDDLIPRLAAAIEAQQGIAVSVSDLFRMGLVRLEREYLPPAPPAAPAPASPRKRRGKA